MVVEREERGRCKEEGREKEEESPEDIKEERRGEGRKGEKEE